MIMHTEGIRLNSISTNMKKYVYMHDFYFAYAQIKLINTFN